MKRATGNPEFQRKLDEGRQTVDDMIAAKAEPNIRKVEALMAAVPSTLENPQKKELIILTPNVKSLIIAYAFIGLVELMEASVKASAKEGEVTLTKDQITERCIERAIHNLHKDGLFDK